MDDVISKTIYGQFFSFNTTLIDKDIVKSAKLYLGVKDTVYRNFCPFAMKHVRCKDICGKVFYSSTIKDSKKCPLKILTKDTLYQIMKEIVDISEIPKTVVEVFG
jgi:hypothetical protein